MRKWIAITMAIVVGASCIPWLRHQHFFSVLLGAITVALFALIVYGGVHTLLTWSKRTRWNSESAPRVWLSKKLRSLLLLGPLFLVLVLVVPHFVAISTDVYKMAVATAHKSPQFMEALGSPVKEGWFGEGKLGWGDQAKSDIVIPVSGRRRNGNLRAFAIKEGGRWRLQELTLELTHPDDHIDLLSAKASPR